MSFFEQIPYKILLPTLRKAIASGISIILCTRAPESDRPEQGDTIEESILLLRENGIQIKLQNELFHRHTVIDKSFVWDGANEYLSFSKKDTNALRFESPDIAGELLDLWKKENNPEQLYVEKCSHPLRKRPLTDLGNYDNLMSNYKLCQPQPL